MKLRTLVHMMLTCAFCQRLGVKPDSLEKFLEIDDLFVYLLLKKDKKPENIWVFPAFGKDMIIIHWSGERNPEVFQTCSARSKCLSLT